MVDIMLTMSEKFDKIKSKATTYDFRTELSCPSSVENGFFAGFIERIFIIDSSNDGTHPTRRLNDDETVTEFEIPVTRK